MALELIHKLCAVEPAPVLIKAESAERERSADARWPGNEYLELLNESRPRGDTLRKVIESG